MKSAKGLCDTCSESTRPALVAARDGHLNCLVFACDSLGLANELDGYSATPLHFSARHGHLDCVEWIVRHNVISPTSVTRGGTTPAHDAAATGQIDCLKFLLSNSKCSLNDRTIEGSTMLHMACRFGRLPMVKWLVGENGVSPNETGVNDVTPIHISAAKDHLKCLQWLTQQPQYIANMETIHGATPTYFAAQEGCFKSLEWLIEHAKGDSKIAAKDGMLPIHAAAQAGHLDCIKLLISRGYGTVNELSKDGGTPIHFASAGGHANTLVWLIRNGGIVNVKDNCRSTPLHDAAEQGQATTVRVLLESGSDPRAMDDECFSPLDLAEESGSAECIHLLRVAASGQTVPPNLQSPQNKQNGKVEIQTPKQRRKGRFSFNFLRGNSVFSRRSATSLDHEEILRRKSKKGYYSNPDSGNQSRTDIFANDNQASNQQSPLMLNALISSKSPEVIRVVRHTQQTTSHSPSYTPPPSRKRSLTGNLDNSNPPSPELSKSTEWTTSKPKKKHIFKTQEVNSESRAKDKANFKSWMQYQSNINKLSTSPNQDVHVGKHNRIYAVRNPLIEAEIQNEEKPERNIIGVDDTVILNKVNFLSENDIEHVGAREFGLPVIPPKPVLSKEQLMRLGDDPYKKDDGISSPSKEDYGDSNYAKRELSLVDERDEISRISTFSAKKSVQLVEPQDQPAADQKRVNASYLTGIKQKRFEMLEAASLALLGPPLIGQRRVNKFFIAIGNDPGIHCWKVGPTSSKLTEITGNGPLSGHFHVLDTYLFLHTSVNGPIFHQIHVWKGHLSDWAIYDKATELAHDLSNSLSGISQIYKEIQGLESDQFISYFKSRVIYYHQSINKPFTQACLYELSGTHAIRCAQSSFGLKQFTTTMMYILISQKTMYLWVGPQATEHLKTAVYNIALEIREKERMTSFLVLDPTQKNEAFNSALRIVEQKPLKSFSKIYHSIHNSNIPIKYYRTMFNEAKRMGYREIRYSPVIFNRDELIFIVMSLRLTVWVGHNKRHQAQDFLGMAQALLKTCFYPELLHCVVLHEFGEDALFIHQFPELERPNLSLLDTETKNELNILPIPVPLMHDAGLGRIKIFEINASGKREQPIAEFGHFNSLYCYFVLYSYRREIKFLSLMYVWIGNEANDNIIRNQEIQLRELQANTPGDQAIIYIPQKLETDHFLSLFKAKFIVHQTSFKRSYEDNSASLYRIFSFNLLSIKAVQVETQASSLLSNSAFVLSSPAKSIVWIGQTTSQNDRRGAMLIAKELKPQEPLTLMEGEETERFWAQLGGKQTYAPVPKEHWPPHHASPILYHFFKGIKPIFTSIPNFTQKDLHIGSVFILDTSSHLFIWHGSMVETFDSRAIVQDYLLQTAPEKSLDKIVLVVLNQGAEPSSFTSLFPAWDDNIWKNPDKRLSQILASKPILKQPPAANNIIRDEARSALNIDASIPAVHIEHEKSLVERLQERRGSPSGTLLTPEPFKIQADAVKEDLMKEINELDEVLKSFELGTAISLPNTEFEHANKKKIKLDALRRGEFSKFMGKPEPVEELDTDALIKELDTTMQQVNRNVLNEEKRRSRTYSNPEELIRTRVNTDVSSMTPYTFLPNLKEPSTTEMLDNYERRPRNESIVSMSGSSTGVPTQLSLVNTPLMLKKTSGGKSPNFAQRKPFSVPVPASKSQEKYVNVNSSQPTGIGAWTPSVVTPKGHFKPPPLSEKNNPEIAKHFRSNVQAKIAKTKAKSPRNDEFPSPALDSTKFLMSLELEATGQIVEFALKRNTLVQNVIYKVVEKCRCKLTPTLSLFEVHPSLNLERKLEDHEVVLNVMQQWPESSGSTGECKLLVRDYLDKYAIMGGILSIDEVEISIHDRSLPRLRSEIFVNRTIPKDEKDWSKVNIEFKIDGIYFWQDERTLRCISRFSGNQLYTFITQETDTPAPYAFALKPLNSWSREELHIFCTPNNEIFSTWYGYITIGIFGLKPLYKDWQIMRKQFSQLLDMKTRSDETP
ncbi:Espin-like [Oopsacas minuta]|uniref:Espin-like n=1 Tax=Oopsacas minuta TaxID=111878 RepID=A0AAV7KDP3_9METZ|nr:Espin-like [Oopsacas minuta]